MPRETIGTRIRNWFKNLFTSRQKEKIDTVIDQNTDALKKMINEPINNIMLLELIKNINDLYKDMKVGMFKMNKQVRERLKRYNDYDFIIQKIPEQKKQLSLFYRLVINPEVYRREFLDISYTGRQIKQKLNSDNVEELDIPNYIRRFLRENDGYKVIKKQIYDQLKYGDGFVQIIPFDFETEKTQIPKIKWKNIPPRRVIILQIGNVKFGYLVLSEELKHRLVDESKLTIDFIQNLVRKNDKNFVKGFIDTVIKRQELSEQSALKEVVDTYNDLFFEEQDDIFERKVFEKVYESEILQEMFQDYQSRKILKESDVSQSLQTGTYLDQFITQIDLTYYFDRSARVDEIKTLLEIDESFEDIVGMQEVLYVPPQLMQNFKTSDFDYYPYGSSIIDMVRPIQSLVLLLEYQVVLYRLLKSPDRKKFIVDVTGIQEERIPEFLNRVKSQFTTQKGIDLTGEVTESLDLLTLFEDYYVLRKDGVELIDIENVEGGDIQSQIDDLKYWRDKLIQSLGIPPSYLGYQESLSGAQTILTIQDQRVQRDVLKLQDDMNEGLDELFRNTFKVLQGYYKSSYYNVLSLINQQFENGELEVTLFPPVSLEQKERQNMIDERLRVIKDIKDMLNVKYEDLFEYFGIFSKSELEQFERNSLKDMKRKKKKKSNKMI